MQKLRLFLAFAVLGALPSTASASSDDVCDALLAPHLAVARLLPNITDDQALGLLKANYSELLGWLSQKADATAEGGVSNPIGAYGPNRDLTPSQLLFDADITEVNRTAVGFLALKWILAGDYEAFTRNQPNPIKLTPQAFAEMRDYVRGVLADPADVDAMIVTILINDLGKIKRYHELINRASQRIIVDHDDVLWVGAREWPETSPSFNRLSAEHKQWILDGLKMGSTLNIGQFAQAENLPANLAGVLPLSGKPEAFEFKIVEMILDIAGARGHEDSAGAKVMIEPVFRSFQAARRALLEVVQGGSLRNAYDTMLIQKARALEEAGFARLDAGTPRDRALLRLMAMRRATHPQQAGEVLDAFDALDAEEREILVRELNFDGVDDGWSTLLYYAPATLVNALSGVKDAEASRRVLRQILRAFARTFQYSRASLQERRGNGVLTVNISEIADFAKSEEFRASPESLGQHELELVNADEGQGLQSFIRVKP